MIKKILIITLVVSLLANVLLIAYTSNFQKENENTQNISDTSQYPYLSPRIFVENQNDFLINFVELRSKINSYISTSGVPKTGFYFEYLPTGASIGVNEKNEYFPASLFKLPLSMATYKYIEKGKIKENDSFTITDSDLDPNFGDLYLRGEGASISVYDTLRFALINSDNTAKNILINNIPQSEIKDVFDSLDIPNEINKKNPVVSAKNYSSILRSLYLSTYNTPEDSNKILYLISETAFEDKMRSGVPKEIPVAHKIGSYIDKVAQTEVYSDCGIIYAPKRPYVLCLMVPASEELSKKIMHDLSSIVYEYIQKKNQ